MDNPLEQLNGTSPKNTIQNNITILYITILVDNKIALPTTKLIMSTYQIPLAICSIYVFLIPNYVSNYLARCIFKQRFLSLTLNYII